MFGFKKKREDPHPMEAVGVFPAKYELVPDFPYPKDISPDGRSVEACRIRALVDIPLHNVKAGDLGGFVEDATILSHKGSSWVGGDAFAARLFESHMHSPFWTDRPLPAMISGDALVTDNAFTRNYIAHKVLVKDKAVVLGRLGGNVIIKDNVKFMDGHIDGHVIISDDVVINHARIYGSNVADGQMATVGGNLIIDNSGDKNNDSFIAVKGDEKISIKGVGRLNTVKIRGNFCFDAEVNLENVSFQGDNTILGKPRIKPDVKFTGRNVISGDSLIPPSSHVHDVQMSGGVLNYQMPIIPLDINASHVTMESSNHTNAVNTADEIQPVIGNAFVGGDVTESIGIIKQIEADYEAYTTDIVKLIKYPGMVDTTIPEVGNFVVKLRSIKRAMKTARADVLADLTDALELAFVNAENKVQTLVASHLDEAKKKSLKTAGQMFALACNEASTEPEKRLGYKAGMKALEGVVVVSETAVEQMKARVGILELEV